MQSSTLEKTVARIQDRAGLDHVTFEVLRNLFEYTCDRMTAVLQRASFSPILSDMVDFSNAIYDPDMRLLSQAANVPVHLAAMKYSAHAVRDEFGIETMRDGDIYVVNDPYRGGTHINDISWIKPVFYRGTELLGFAVSRGHWMDFGGGAPGGQAWGTHIAEEGLRLPPIKAFENGTVKPDILKILLANTRTPHFIQGDLQAHVGCLKAAEEELRAAAERYGVATIKAAMAELIAYTERIVRARIADIPDGVYEGEDYADTDGQTDAPVKVKATLTVAGSDITVDLTGSDPQCLGAINSPEANTHSAVFYSLQFFLEPNAPQNEGMFNPIAVILPDDCWLNPKWPAPTIGCTVLAAPKVASAVWQAVAKALPDRAVGSACGDCNWFVCGVREADGKTDVFSDLPAGGWGGTPFADGMNVTMDPLGNCMNMEAETAELMFPIAYEAFDIRQDSAGDGCHRGGLGSNLKIRFLCDGAMSVETARTREGTPGVNGGRRSAPQRLWHLSPDGGEKIVGGIDEAGRWHNPLLRGHKLGHGDTFWFETTGGGGWGNPLDRPEQAVLDDVLDEYVSVEKARAVYGVVVDLAAKAVDGAATQQLRAEMRSDA